MQNEYRTYRNRPSLERVLDQSHHGGVEEFDRGGYDFFELFRNRISTESLESLLKLVYRQEKLRENWLNSEKK